MRIRRHIPFPPRWNNLPEGHLITRAEVELVTGISPSTLSAHCYAGLLPFIPGRPVYHRVGDLRIYFAMMSNGVGATLHRSLRVEHEDRQAYNVLHGVAEFTARPQSTMIKTVVHETEILWRKYKEKNKNEKLKARRERLKKGSTQPTKSAA